MEQQFKIPRILWIGNVYPESESCHGKPITVRLVETEEAIVCEIEGEKDCMGQAKWTRLTYDIYILEQALKKWVVQLPPPVAFGGRYA